LIRLALLVALEEAPALLWSGIDGHSPHLLQIVLQGGCFRLAGLTTPVPERGKFLMSKYGYYLMSIYIQASWKVVEIQQLWPDTGSVSIGISLVTCSMGQVECSCVIMAHGPCGSWQKEKLGAR
jgi:hypothetical protein